MLLRTENLKVYFTRKHKTVKALDGVDIALEPGVTTALAGESGCGKTTLAWAILGFNHPQEGRIYYQDTDISDKKNEPLLRKNIQIVFQNPYLSLDPRYTVFNTLYEVIRVFRKVTKDRARDIIYQALAEVELDKDISGRFPHQLSGGQRQRVCIARSIINNPPLVIFDEPTSSLDVTTAAKIIQLLINLQKKHNSTFLFISHNLKLLNKVAKVWYIMYYGKIVESGPAQSIYDNPRHPYTKILRQAADYRLKDLDQGEVPDRGCPFIPRCDRQVSACAKPCPKQEVAPGHYVFCHNL